MNKASIMALAIAVVTLALTAGSACAQPDGFITKDGQKLFPIGFYELPEDDAGLQAMAAAGVNLVHCHSREDLDRVQAVGLMGVRPLGLQQGDTDKLREAVAAVADHPALAVWEGPDEVVWNFTAFSGLFRTHKVHKEKGAWWKQAPEAIEYAEKQAATIIPNMRAAAAMIREMDKEGRPIWINEAQRSDTYYCRQYMDFVDITGCDIYPVSASERNVEAVGPMTERWKQVGRGKPVYMVLQAFSWDELGDYYGHKETAYPTFADSRFMAYDVVAHGARGILYWGSRFLKSDTFRQSIYALTSELSMLQPFLTAPEVDGVELELVEVPDDEPDDVVYTVRQAGDDWLVVLVNEDEESHMDTVLKGLGGAEGRVLEELYGTGSQTVAHGELIVRLLPKEVKVYATGRRWETDKREGREF